MTAILAFSGGCNSGKSTTMLKLSLDLQKRGYSVKTNNEIIRTKIDMPIDKVRYEAKQYIDLQHEIISEKIKQEKHADNSEYDFVFFDRSIIDSMFYLCFYVDKARLSKEYWSKYCKLYKKVKKHIDLAFNKIYTRVILFEPLSKLYEHDICRPKNVLQMSEIEYDLIRMATEQNAFDNQVIYYNCEKDNYDYLLSQIIRLGYLYSE